jgi:RNA polymerase sigma factor (sigma-70 family)
MKMKAKILGIWYGPEHQRTGQEIRPERQDKIGTFACENKPRVFDDLYLMQLRAGDEDTAKHFDRYFRRLLRLKLWGKFTREREEELIDSVMTAALEKILNGNPRDAACLAAYITGICANLTKRALRPSFNNIGADPDEIQIANGENNAEEKLLSRERAEGVRRVLGTLGMRDRGVLVDLFYHDTERDEVCRKYRVTRQTLRLIVFRARRRFQSTWRCQTQGRCPVA